MANTSWSTTDKTSGITLSGGNLIATSTSGAITAGRAADRQALGKFYWEITANTIASAATGFGIANTQAALGTAIYTGNNLNACMAWRASAVYMNGVSTGINFGTITAGSVICFALDLDNRRFWIRVGAAGNWNANVANSPVTNVGGIDVGSIVGHGLPAYPIYALGTTSEQITANFGDTAFTGAVPSGYTSGFTAGTSVPTNAIASQALAEHWLTTNPDARITQVVAEHWASTTSTGLQAVVTFVALEHWTSVAVVVPAAGGPQVTMIH